MILYNKEWLDNLRVLKTLENWFRKDLISQNQKTEISQQFICGYKHTNFFVRIGLFLFTFILTSSAIGLVLLFTGSAFEDNFGIMALIFSGIIWFVLETFIKNKKYFRNGIDDMLLYISLAYFITGVGLIVSEMGFTAELNMVLLAAVIVLPLHIIAAIRFTDAFVSLVSYLIMLLIVFILVHNTGAIGKALMPFVLMIVSYSTYWFVIKLKKQESKYYWHRCLSTVETAALITLYAAGNYFVVRESSALLLNLSLKPGEDLPLAIIFYVMTLVIPVAYIFAGIRNKDRIPLRTGIILAALSILTYRYYYHFVEAEVAMIAGGVFLIGLMWFVISKLKTPWKGISYKASDDPASLVEAESLLVAQTFGQQASKTDDVEFGGGKFGGGGAGGNY